MTRYITAHVWAAYLDNAHVGDLDIDQQAALIEGRINDAALACMADPGIEATLVRLGEQYMRGKYPKLFGP